MEEMVDYEIDFLPVGNSNGDAICMRYGAPDSFYVHVTDGAYAETGETIIRHIERHYGKHVHINNMALSHACNDHALGLIPVLKRFEVKALWMNRPWDYAAYALDNFHGNYTLQGLIDYMKETHPYLVELEELAKKRGTPVNSAFRGQQIVNFTLLAPSVQRYIDLIPHLDKTPDPYPVKKKSIVGSVFDSVTAVLETVMEKWDFETLDEDPPATSASNETCIVQLGVFGNRKVLLTADVGPDGLNEAADYAEMVGLLSPPDFVQIPHHGSRRNITPSVLDRWLGTRVANDSIKRGSAYVSVGADADLYPRKKVKNAFMRRGYPVYATRGSTKNNHHGSSFNNRDWHKATPEAFAYNVSDE
jgi:beta-lactamase superfamily II metal-dependent hydrolase